jgi:ATP-dependent helicase/DNAse subunit B
MINGKKKVFISYVAEEKRDIRSRFIDFLVKDGVVVDESKIQLDRVSLNISKREIEKSKEILKYLSQKLQNHGLSPTHLRDYKQCPYRFYLKYICSIQEPKEIIEEPGPKEWGSIIHIALKNFYKYDFPDGLTDKEKDEAKISLYKRLDDAIKQVLAKNPKNITFLDLEIYKKRLDKFLSLEVERFQSGFKIDISKLEKKLDYTITVNNNKIILGGNTDRIDIFNNRYYIIDYKSSVPSKKEYQIGADFMEFQLPLYALISSCEDFEKIGGMIYYVIAKEIKIIEIVKDDALSQFLRDFKEQILLPTIQEIVNPEVNFYSTEIQDNCEYCNYINLCGVKNVKKY